MKQIFAVICLLLVAGSLGAQYDYSTESIPYFEVHHDFSLSSSAAKFSIEIPTSAGRRYFLSEGFVQCTVAAVVSQTIGATIGSGSSATPTALNIATYTPTATVKYGGTITGGSAVAPDIPLAASEKLPLALNKIVFPAGTANSYAINTDSISGTCRIGLIFGAKK